MPESNQHLVEAIITLLEGYCQHEGNKRRQNDYKYLACQCIRQYASPSNHYHVSVAAQELWDKLTTKRIEDYFYRDPIVLDKLDLPLELPVYYGASKKGHPRLLDRNSKIVFNNLFQCDHVVPVKTFFERLVRLCDQGLTPDIVNNVLDEIHLCTITKDEDHNIGRTRCRYETFEKTLTEGAYKEVPLVMDSYLTSIGYKR